MNKLPRLSLAALSSLIASAGVNAAIDHCAPVSYPTPWMKNPSGPTKAHRAGKRYGASVRQHQRQAAKARNRAAAR